MAALNLPDYGAGQDKFQSFYDDVIAAITALNNATDQNKLATKTISIGTWNMVSTGIVQINHGITSGQSKIRSIFTLIYNDSGVPTTIDSGNVGSQAGNIDTWTDTYVQLSRDASGGFNSTLYDGAANRGYITITYEK